MSMKGVHIGAVGDGEARPCFATGFESFSDVLAVSTIWLELERLLNSVDGGMEGPGYCH